MNYKFDNMESGGTSGLDAFFASEPQIVTPTGKTASAPVKSPRIKIGSLSQLAGFTRISADTLIHKSTKDLWAIRKDGDNYFIERLFQGEGPVKG